MRKLALVLALPVLLALAFGCSPNTFVTKSIGTQCIWDGQVDPAPLRTFQMLRISEIIDDCSEDTFREFFPDAAAAELKSFSSMSRLSLVFTEDLVRDYLTLRGYTEAPSAAVPDFTVTVLYATYSRENYVPPQIITVQRHVPGVTFTRDVDIVDSVGTSRAQVNTTYDIPDTYTEEERIKPGYNVTNRYIDFYVAVGTNPTDPAALFSWVGRAHTPQAGLFELDAIDLAWAALTRFYARNSSWPGALGAGIVNQGTCVRVVQTPLGSPAFDAGIRINDLILNINGRNVRNVPEAIAAAAVAPAGATVSVTVLRKNQTLTFHVPLAAREFTSLYNY